MVVMYSWIKFHMMLVQLKITSHLLKNSLMGKDDNEIQILDHQTLSKDGYFLHKEGALSVL